MRVACCQIACQPAQPPANLDRARRAVREALDRGADLVLLPEAWLSGFVMDRVAEWASQAEEAWAAVLAEAGDWPGFLCPGSLFVGDGGCHYNEMRLFQGGQEIARCRKLHLFGALGEVEVLTPGQGVTVADLGGHTAGLAICYDLRFPEVFRRQLRRGAELFLLPAQWPHPRIAHWRLLAQARAVENLAFMVALNAAGTPEINRLYGHSMVIAPWGEILWEGGQEDVVQIVDLDLDRVREAREALPSVVDLRDDLFT